jgi:hypothetical protein
MKNIFAGLFAKTPNPPVVTQSAAHNPKDVAAGLRSMVLNLSAAEIGITPHVFPHQVWGIVMETGMSGGYYTLAVLADATTSLYFSNGGGILGAGEKPEVRKVSEQFIGWANRFVGSSSPATSLQPPSQGQTKFFFLTFNGVQSYEAPELELGEKRDSLAPLFHAGHAMIAAVRQTQQTAAKV